jgi:glycosyltransferase involved in cell wall biosynthesis
MFVAKEVKMYQPKYSLVIPCFNEEQSLLILIPEVIKLAQNFDYEFILVNNGSTDKTNQLFMAISQENIKFVNLKENAGYGGGIKAGLRLAKGEFLGWIHADLQYSLTDIVQKLNKQRSGFTYIKGLRKKRHFYQNTISLCMSIFESLIFQKILFDINAQPTIFHKNLYLKMNNIPDDFSIDLYSYVMAKKYKAQIGRFEVNFLKRRHGSSHWNTGVSSVFAMSIRTLRYSMMLRKNIDNH